MRRVSPEMKWTAAFLSSLLMSLFATTVHGSLVISNDATVNVSCSGNVCTGTLRNAVLNLTTLQSMLADGDVKVIAGKSKNIVVAAPLFWSSSSRLTLGSSGTLELQQSIQVAGTGGLTILSDEASVLYDSGASISFWDTSSALTIGNHEYKLVGDLASLASKAEIYYVALARNYDAAADGVYSSAPVHKVYYGFDGLGNTISNLTVVDTAASQTVGLAGSSYWGAFIAHVHLTNAHVSGGDNSWVGGLVGVNDGNLLDDSVGGSVQTGATVGGGSALAGGLSGLNGALIDGSSSSVDVSGGAASTVGGLVGLSEEYIRYSGASGAVTGGGTGSMAGGLAGALRYGTIGPSTATGSVTGAQYAGGLVGYSQGGIGNSNASGAVTGSDGAMIGGFVGYAAGPVSDAFATGTVTMTGTGIAGGLVGENHALIHDCYATAPVSGGGTSAVGGLVGLNAQQIRYAYASGQVTGADPHRTGGFVGVDSAAPNSIVDDYWDMTTTGIKNPSRGAGNVSNDPGITGLTNTELRAGLPNGFSENIWNQRGKVNKGLPFIRYWPPQ